MLNFKCLYWFMWRRQQLSVLMASFVWGVCLRSGFLLTNISPLHTNSRQWTVYPSLLLDSTCYLFIYCFLPWKLDINRFPFFLPLFLRSEIPSCCDRPHLKVYFYSIIYSLPIDVCSRGISTFQKDVTLFWKSAINTARLIFDLRKSIVSFIMKHAGNF